MTNDHVKNRVKEIFENTIENGIKYSGSIKNIDYYNLFCKAASADKLYKILGNNVCMFNYDFENKDSVMMIFFMPINLNDSGTKNIAERVIEIVSLIEDSLITVDYLNSEEIKEDKFIYITAIKVIGEKNEQENY